MRTDSENQRKLRICVYGGTNLDASEARLIRELTRRILEKMDAVIVTGGFLRFLDGPKNSCSTDRAALDGCRQFVKGSKRAIKLRACFEAWLPASALDRREEGVVRMDSRKHRITVRSMGQRSALGRRLAMVKEVDLVVTISGQTHTNTVLEQALETNTPALPIPLKTCDHERDSERFWRQHKARVRDWFDMEPRHSRLLDGLARGRTDLDIDDTATSLQEILQRAKLGSCLVLMKYGGEAEKFYGRIEKMIRRVMTPERLDRKPGSEPIHSNFYDAVDRAHGVIADVTDIKQSLPLAYEIGYIHAKGMSPLLLTRESSPKLPVYIRDLNVVRPQPYYKLAEIVRDYLEQAKLAREADRR